MTDLSPETVGKLVADNAKLREQVEVLSNAYAEAVVIIAKWSPGGLDRLRALAAGDRS